MRNRKGAVYLWLVVGVVGYVSSRDPFLPLERFWGQWLLANEVLFIMLYFTIFCFIRQFNIFMLVYGLEKQQQQKTITKKKNKTKSKENGFVNFNI